MENKSVTLKFCAVNRDIFEAIRTGKKQVETRAATGRYREIKTGDKLIFSCGRSRFIKKVKKAKIFKTVRQLVKKYKPIEINPNYQTEKEIRDMYYSFPGYREKIKKHGLIAIEL